MNRLLSVQSGAAALGQSELVCGFGSFKLDPDEAIIVTLEPPKSIELGNLAWGSLDYVNHTSSFTEHHAIRNSDGLYRFVICAADPGIANWLDTTRHNQGMNLYRYFLPESTPTPAVQEVTLRELGALLRPRYEADHS